MLSLFEETITMNLDWNREPQMDAGKKPSIETKGYTTKAPHLMTKEERNTLFECLETELQLQKLPTSYGLPRIAHADEFMIMHTTEEGIIGFKHICTRNYVFLIPSESQNREYDLYVPVSKEYFMRGQFDE
jgi:hypothetical protein